jgi:osmotically-inducible protein OsmY
MHKPKNLEKDVQDELDWDPLLDDKRISVSVGDGRVTLTGAVDTYFDRLRASTDAWTVRGVTQVDNELLVGPVGEAIADALVALDCMTVLAANRFVPVGAVSVQVSDGWVTLTGQVHRHYQRRAAERAVESIKGVRGLSNEIVVSGRSVPEDVTEQISQALGRNAAIDGTNIQVSHSGNVVYLDGTTGTWSSMEEAIETAERAPGVTEVVNRLVVVPSLF